MWSLYCQAFHGAFKEASTRDAVTAYREYKQVLQNIVCTEEMIKKESGGDADLKNSQQRLKDARREKERSTKKN